MNLPSLKATLDANKGVLQLPLIKNKKTINPRDSDTPAVFQLETAMGSAIECFDDAGAVVVPRDRFAPVKTCNDLFALRSDVYEVCADFAECRYADISSCSCRRDFEVSVLSSCQAVMKPTCMCSGLCFCQLDQLYGQFCVICCTRVGC